MDKRDLSVGKDPKTGRFLPGNVGGPGRRPGSLNKKPLRDARRLMEEEDYDSIKGLIKLSKADDVDCDILVKIHIYLAGIQYQDPEKDKDVIDTELVHPSGVATMSDQQLLEYDSNV